MGTWVCNYHLCCCLYPLKKGLLVWGYMNLIRYCLLDGFTTTLTANRIRYHFIYEDVQYRDILSISLMFVVTFALSTANLVFNILFVVGIHKNDDKKLRNHYIFWIVKVVIYATFIVAANVFSLIFIDVRQWLVWHIDPVTNYLTVESPAVGALDIVVQIYFIALVRSHYKSDKGDQRAIIDFFDWELNHGNNRQTSMVETGNRNSIEDTETAVDIQPTTNLQSRF